MTTRLNDAEIAEMDALIEPLLQYSSLQVRQLARAVALLAMERGIDMGREAKK